MTAATVVLPLSTLLAIAAVGWGTARYWRSTAWGLMAGPVIWLWVTVVAGEAWSVTGLFGVATLVGTQLAIASAAVVVARRRLALWPRGRRMRLGPWLWLWLALTSLLLLTVLTTAPNNLDSLAYHLVKADQWWSQGSLDHFPTPYPAQVYLGPAAELGVMHLLADSRGWIALAGLLQFAAHVGCAAGAWLIAGNLGGDRNAQGLAALIATTAPVAVAQATTTQNDYVVALALTACVAVVTDRDRSRVAARLVVFGLAAGVAVATKATAVLFLWPVVIWGAWALRRDVTRRHLMALVATGLLLCLPLVGWAVRNDATFGSPLGPPSALTVDSPDAAGIVVNVVRNLGHAVGTPVSSVNDRVASMAAAVVGSEINDTAWIYGADAWGIDAQLNEDRAPWPLQAALLLTVVVLLLARPRSPTAKAVFPLLAAITAGFLTFCAVLRWQPWGGRLLLPLVVLAGVVVALGLARLPRPWQAVAVACIVVQALPWVLQSTWRPLIGPASTLRTSASAELFAARPDLEAPLTEAVHHVLASRPRVVALGAGTYPVEYQIRWLTRRATTRNVAFTHTDAEPFTAAIPHPAAPEAGLCLCDTAPPGAATRRFGPVLTWSTVPAAVG